VLTETYVPLLFARAEKSKDSSQPLAPEPLVIDEDVLFFQWAPDFGFVCNDSVAATMHNIQIPQSDLCIGSMPPRSVQIVNPTLGKVLFNSAVVPDELTIRRRRVPVRTTPIRPVWITRQERVVAPSDGADAESHLPRHARISDTPPEQLRLTKDLSDYCFYSTAFRWRSEVIARRVAADGSDDICISFEACDFARVYVNGTTVAHSGEPLWEDRKPNKWNQGDNFPGFRHQMRVPLEQFTKLCGEEQSFTLTVLCCALGLVKGDWQLGSGPEANMLEERKGLLSDVSLTLSSSADSRGEVVASRERPWTAVAGLLGEAEKWPDAGKLGGSAQVLDIQCTGEMSLSWFETEIEVDAVSKSWVLDLGGMGKGVLWVNGYLLGRYWNVPGTRPRNGFLDDSPIVQDDAGPPTQRYYHIPAWVVREDDKLGLRITLFEETAANPVAANVAVLEVV
jgi:hypothetical protein